MERFTLPLHVHFSLQFITLHLTTQSAVTSMGIPDMLETV